MSVNQTEHWNSLKDIANQVAILLTVFVVSGGQPDILCKEFTWFTYLPALWQRLLFTIGRGSIHGFTCITM